MAAWCQQRRVVPACDRGLLANGGLRLRAVLGEAVLNENDSCQRKNSLLWQRIWLSYFRPLAQCCIQHHHQHKSQHQPAGGKGFVAFAVGLGDDFVADHEQHGAGSKAQTPGQ